MNIIISIYLLLVIVFYLIQSKCIIYNDILFYKENNIENIINYNNIIINPNLYEYIAFRDWNPVW